MARRGGFAGGMPGNMNNMIKQAQRLQRQMEEQQKVLAETEFTGSAGGGAVSVVLTGLREMQKVSINPEVCDPEDTETLEEMIVLAYNDAVAKINAQTENAGAGMGGMGLGF